MGRRGEGEGSEAGTSGHARAPKRWSATHDELLDARRNLLAARQRLVDLDAHPRWQVEHGIDAGGRRGRGGRRRRQGACGSAGAGEEGGQQKRGGRRCSIVKPHRRFSGSGLPAEGPGRGRRGRRRQTDCCKGAPNPRGAASQSMQGRELDLGRDAVGDQEASARRNQARVRCVKCAP